MSSAFACTTQVAPNVRNDPLHPSQLPAADADKVAVRVPRFLWSSVAVISTGVLASILAFGLSLLAIPRPGHACTTNPNTRRFAYIGFDLFMWVVVAGVFLSHFETSFPIALHHNYAKAMFFLSLAIIAATHIAMFMLPHSKDAERVSDFLCFFTFNVFCVCALKLAKKMLMCDLRNKSPRPNRQPLSMVSRTSIIFRLIIGSMAAYGSSLVITNPLLSAASVAATLVLGISASVVAMRHRKRRRRSFDFGVLLWTAYHVGPISRRIVIILHNSLPIGYTLLLVLGYRTTLATCGFILDDLMDAAFGQWTLWPAFFIRITEALVSITLAFNDSPNGIIGYLVSNFVVSVVKDCGLFDDCRFLLRNGFCVLSPIDSIEASGESAALSRAPTITLREATSGSASISSSKVRTGIPLLVSIGKSIVGRITRRFRAVQLSRLHLDLRLQIERSETTFLSRLTALASLASVHIMALVIGRTPLDRIEEFPLQSQATWLLALSLVELGLSRAVASAAIQWKLRRFFHIKGKVDRCISINKVKSSLSMASFSSSSHMPQSMSSSSFGILMSEDLNSAQVAATRPEGSVNPASPIPTQLAAVDSDPTGKVPNTPSPSPELAPLSQWSTELPWRSNPSLAALVLLTVVYSAATQYGPW
ncbi:hypothetical protein BCR44DRAFT_411538 [Catenaria anguillulae PL171]|uniref:Uncharacterized protein n=1 Tax=Catenaria anguillulae PL171 TaxID=765915 RepID=A0A1Y2HS84_9FUNG|nr:hypothetical protein BCR44DRAFT_411538 [Catenaria anguillulae PL171]